MKNMKSRCRKNEQHLYMLKDEVLTKYHSKSEIQEEFLRGNMISVPYFFLNLTLPLNSEFIFLLSMIMLVRKISIRSL